MACPNPFIFDYALLHTKFTSRTNMIFDTLIYRLVKKSLILYIT
jgi:hypothetical protein